MRFALLLLIVLAFGGCGRRGALEPPPERSTQGDVQGPSKGTDTPPNEIRRFPLDPLI